MEINLLSELNLGWRKCWKEPESVSHFRRMVCRSLELKGILVANRDFKTTSTRSGGFVWANSAKQAMSMKFKIRYILKLITRIEWLDRQTSIKGYWMYIFAINWIRYLSQKALKASKKTNLSVRNTSEEMNFSLNFYDVPWLIANGSFDLKYY